MRLVARATGILAAAPAEAFHAPAVTPADTSLGDQHAVATEGGHRTDDGPEVARVGDAVERREQGSLTRRRVGPSQQVVGVGVDVRRDLQRDPLMDRPPGEAVDLGAWGLEEGQLLPADAIRRISRTRSSDSIALSDVQGLDGYVRAQRLEHAVATRDDLEGVTGSRSAYRSCAVRVPEWLPTAWP